MFSLRCQGGQCVSAIDFNKSSPKESELRDKNILVVFVGQLFT